MGELRLHSGMRSEDVGSILDSRSSFPDEIPATVTPSLSQVQGSDDCVQTEHLAGARYCLSSKYTRNYPKNGLLSHSYLRKHGYCVAEKLTRVTPTNGGRHTGVSLHI